MVKITMWLDFSSKEKFLKSLVWTWLDKHIINRSICIAFHLDETEDVSL